MNYKIFSLIIMTGLFSGCTLGTTPIQKTNSENKSTNTTPISNEIPSQNNSSNNFDLSSQNLTKIPDYVFKQTYLEELNVSNNNLTGAIQAEIRQLTRLKVLNASNNQMTGVPAEIGQLTNLQVLDLSNNQLTGLPNELGNLKNLKTLNISGNNYSSADLKIISDKLPSSVNIIK